MSLAPVRTIRSTSGGKRPIIPTIELMFRHVTSLDFRVYRVQDPAKFFAGLRDPHALGSEQPNVPQEQTLIERIARWKAARREEIVRFVRLQFSWEYRNARREARAQKEIALRRPLRYNQFAQVPLLNAAGLVSSWREMLPPVRETEVRRIPLDLPGQGVYVVEAVSAPYRAYTIVIVSDIGLVTKASPGQLVMFAANPVYMDVDLEAGASFVQPIPPGHTAVAYVFQRFAAGVTDNQALVLNGQFGEERLKTAIADLAEGEDTIPSYKDRLLPL